MPNEDSQPNERIDKRRAVPSLVNRGRGRGRGRARGAALNTRFHPPAVQHAAPRNPFRLPDPSNGHFGPKNPLAITHASVSRVPDPPSFAPRVIPRPAVAPVSRPSLPLQRRDGQGPVQVPNKAPVPRTFDSPPPSKRRRLDTDVPTTIKCEPPPSPIIPPVRLFSPPARVKLEHQTPSPPPSSPPRRSVTSGSKRYFPVPFDCTRANPHYQENRRKWMLKECTLLRELGLRVVRFFFRDDGMVIEWTSAQPVWFDTLRPVHPRTPPPVTHEIIDVDAESPPPSVSDRPSPAVSVISVPSSPTPEEISPEAEQERLHQLGLDFLLKYISTFDNDRPSLATAYSEDAIFSFRDNNFASADHFTFQRTRQTHSKSSMPKLPALQNYRFAPQDDEIVLDYDTVVQECMVDTPPRVILTVYGQLVGPDQRTLGIDQCFLLQRADDTDGWPLIAISHHMVVRDTPWVRWKGTLDGVWM